MCAEIEWFKQKRNIHNKKNAEKLIDDKKKQKDAMKR